MRIGIINNCSAARFIYCPLPAGWQAIHDTPVQLAQLARNGQLDAALVSSAALPALSGFQCLPWGIASRQRAFSVQLFCNTDITTLIRQQLPVRISEQSLTASALLDVLCRQDLGQTPHRASGDARPVAGCLLIGDQALAEIAAGHWQQRHDLGQWWFDQTGLPMVWAQWMVRRELDVPTRQQLLQWIECCVADNASDAAIQRYLARFGSACQPSEYGSAIYHQLVDREIQSIQLFQQRLAG